MLNALDIISIWLIRIGLTIIFLMMAGYIGLDLFVQYVEANYIVLPKN